MLLQKRYKLTKEKLACVNTLDYILHVECNPLVIHRSADVPKDRTFLIANASYQNTFDLIGNH